MRDVEGICCRLSIAPRTGSVGIGGGNLKRRHGAKHFDNGINGGGGGDFRYCNGDVVVVLISSTFQRFL